MKKFLPILFACMAYLLFSSKSCAPEKPENSISPEVKLIEDRQAIGREFEAEYLSSKSLKAYEVKAIQKLVDFSDYLRIFTDRQVDTTFRYHSGKMIWELFDSDSVRINADLITNSKRKKLSLTELLNRVGEINTCDLSFDSIRISNHFRKINDAKYVGDISFSRGLKICTKLDTINLPIARLEAEIYLTKVKKIFGNDTLLVWTVLLGDIK